MKLPKQAKKIFTGIIFDVYHWPQKMYDGTTKTFEMIKRPNTVQILATSGTDIFICKQIQPHHKKYLYSLFGGRVDKGETALQAAKRELLEESGLVSKDWELIKTYEPHNEIDWTIHFYIARNCQKISEQNLDSGEKIIIKKINFDEFCSLLIDQKISAINLAFEVLKLKSENKLDLLKNKLFKK